ncbi:MAG: hypothetical protein KAX54_00180 [Thauera sp.]|nr:hypothetical protein [Thauera sp.]
MTTGLVASYSAGEMHRSDPHYIRESLYRRRDGRLQFLGFGGEATEYGIDLPPREKDEDGNPIPRRAHDCTTYWMTPERAQAWMEERGVQPLLPIAGA